MFFMKILVINCGSSSVKYKLYNMEDESVCAEGSVQRIGISGSTLEHKAGQGKSIKRNIDVADHDIAMKMILDMLVDPQVGVLDSVEEIYAVGHRVVHGGELIKETTIVNDKTMKDLESCIELAPLHNPAHIMGINACLKLMPGIKGAMVLDTAFHMTLPKHAYMYGIPYEYYEKYGIRKYGFHGTSHRYVSQRAAVVLGKPIEELKIITCHLGNGASMDAVKYGKAVETSMGFTPLAGLLMGTRCGDIDPAMVPFIMEKEGMTPQEASREFLNKKSGLLGVSGISNDMRDVVEAMENGNERAKLAFDMFCYRIRKYVGAYMVAMEGLDAMVFTAGIGENQGETREAICSGLEFLGLSLDPEKNKMSKQELIISTPESRIKVLIIPTDEELVIARETMNLMGQKG